MKIQVPKPIARFFFRIRALFPSQLPVGVSEFNNYCDKIIDACGFPNDPSYRHTIGTMIMQLSPTTDKKSTQYFIKSIRKAMANEIAYFVIMQIRDERAAKEKEEKLAATDNKGESHEAIPK